MPLRGARVSTAARPAVSGSRPFQWNRGELNPVAVLARRLSPASDPSSGDRGTGQETENSPTVSCFLPPVSRSDRGGSRTHTAQALDLPALPIGLPGHIREAGETPALQLQTRELNPASGL